MRWPSGRWFRFPVPPQSDVLDSFIHKLSRGRRWMLAHGLGNFLACFRIFVQDVQNLKLEPLPFRKPVEIGVLLRLRFFAELPLRSGALLSGWGGTSFTPSHVSIVSTRRFRCGERPAACRWKHGDLTLR